MVLRLRIQTITHPDQADLNPSFAYPLFHLLLGSKSKIRRQANSSSNHPVVLIIDDLEIRVMNKTTGELIRHLTLNPDVGYQPRFKT